MPVVLFFDLAVICFSGICRGLYFAARSERITFFFQEPSDAQPWVTLQGLLPNFQILD